MRSIRHLGVWIKRFRHRCGYGVHSPFAFNFITGVIFERGDFYAYRVLDPLYKHGIFWRFSHERTCWHFLLRLANFVRPECFWGDACVTVPESAYLSAGSRRTLWAPEDYADRLQGERILVCMSADVSRLPSLLRSIREKADPGSALLLKTDSDRLREQCLEIIRQSADCGVSFDLYDYLLVFFDLTLYKQHYIINFFD